MSQHALGNGELPLEFFDHRWFGAQVRQYVDTVASACDRVGEASSFPGADLLDFGAAAGGKLGETLLDGGDILVGDRRVNNEHYLVVANRRDPPPYGLARPPRWEQEGQVQRARRLRAADPTVGIIPWGRERGKGEMGTAGAVGLR